MTARDSRHVAHEVKPVNRLSVLASRTRVNHAREIRKPLAKVNLTLLSSECLDERISAFCDDLFVSLQRGGIERSVPRFAPASMLDGVAFSDERKTVAKGHLGVEPIAWARTMSVTSFTRVVSTYGDLWGWY